MFCCSQPSLFLSLTHFKKSHCVGHCQWLVAIWQLSVIAPRLYFDCKEKQASIASQRTNHWKQMCLFSDSRNVRTDDVAKISCHYFNDLAASNMKMSSTKLMRCLLSGYCEATISSTGTFDWFECLNMNQNEFHEFLEKMRNSCFVKYKFSFTELRLNRYQWKNETAQLSWT